MKRCELCGEEIPDMDDDEFIEKGYRSLVWGNQGPFYFCPLHPRDAVTVWAAEALICDRGFAKSMREKYGTIPDVEIRIRPDAEIRIKMCHTIRGSPILSKPGTVLRAGDEYAGKTNRNGAVSGLCNNGEWLGVAPGEFEFLTAPEWLLRIHEALN